MTPTSEVVLEMPTDTLYSEFLATVPVKPKDKSSCLVLFTVYAQGKTATTKGARGEAGAVVQMKPAKYSDIFYFGALQDPLKSHGNATSIDGEVVIEDVPVSTDVYEVTATKKGVSFTSMLFKCPNQGAFINGANHGPRARQKSQN